MNIIPAELWTKVEPAIRKQCPRLTATDISETQNRVDLLIAKIQNRQWISRREAQRLVLSALKGAGMPVEA
jgi:hypothetical protein